jgi:uracil-DNA glycosylase
MSTHIRPFLRLLQRYRAAQVFNPWAERNPDDHGGNGPRARRERLAAHLDVAATHLLIGEAPGYQGCRISGIPFTSERLLMAGAIPRVTPDGSRLSTRPRPWSEPSATILWSALHELGIERTTVLWNAFPWHPHRAGEPYSNRAPTRAECACGLSVLSLLLEALPEARLFAVGRHAQRALAALGRDTVLLRHPAQGGAVEFRRTLRRAVRSRRRRAVRPK